METQFVAVVEDEADLREAVVDYLEAKGLDVTGVRDGRALRDLVAARRVDLVILDLALPGEDGLSLCRWLRRETRAGIIMATGSSQPIDRVVGLEIGADDYVVKPYDLRELLARVRSVLRRVAREPEAAPAASPPSTTTPAPASETGLKFGGLTAFVQGRRLVDAEGGGVALTASEFDLVRVFAERPGRPLSRAAIAQLVDGRDLDPADRSIDIRITRCAGNWKRRRAAGISSAPCAARAIAMTRPISDAAALSRRHRRVVVIAGGLLVALFAVLIWREYRDTLGRELDLRAGMAQERLAVVEGIVKAADVHVDAMRTAFLADLASPAGTATTPGHLAADAAAGAIFATPEPAPATAHRGGLVMGPRAALAARPEDDPELIAAERLFPLMAAVHATENFFRWSYYFTARKDFVLIWPWASAVSMLGPEETRLASFLGYFDYDVYRLTEIAGNPARRASWTHVYVDAGGAGLMVSHNAPVDVDGRQMGMIGTDVLLSVFSEALALPEWAKDSLVLVDGAGNVVADSRGVARNASELTPAASLVDLTGEAEPGLFGFARAGDAFRLDFSVDARRGGCTIRSRRRWSRPRPSAACCPSSPFSPCWSPCWCSPTWRSPGPSWNPPSPWPVWSSGWQRPVIPATARCFPPRGGPSPTGSPVRIWRFWTPIAGWSPPSARRAR
ncbi:response regulator [Methylobrevis pamukkalensis]|uniref:Transcriptional regulatory protein OmpR n=1 Tax=Methylobrevis pamukkalensis TaxID=1439726 RepID=A0A1E3H4C3_9HYPH|nr:response regulator [Methylobrevis pamukkalensis]ODN71162.1 Transcriptional regulatory protein OmpR [Methylobrevis pamukkalensis]